MTTISSVPARSVPTGIPGPLRRRGYILTAAVLLAMMAAGTLPILLYEKSMGFGPLGVTVVLGAFAVGTLLALLALGDVSDHVGRRKVLATAVACTAASIALFLAASGVGVLIAATLPLLLSPRIGRLNLRSPASVTRVTAASPSAWVR